MDLYPAKAQFLTGEEVSLVLETDGVLPWTAEVQVYRLNEAIRNVTAHGLTSRAELSLGGFDAGFAGYGVSVHLSDGANSVVLETAFDVVDRPGRSMRYGFLSDFDQDDNGAAIDWFCKCHLNLAQYYDWSFRHHQLVAPEDCYRDMMGKEISKDVVRRKIRQAGERGIRSIAYGAVYAAGRDFFEAHRDWAFYNSDGHPFVFIGVFYLMNLRRGSPWREYLLEQYRSAIEEMGFHGIHMDTYGFPKTAYSHLAPVPELVRLDEEFPSLIRETRDALGENACLIFNNVGSWPTYATAAAPQDVVYLEVWPPYTHYAHIAQLIREAKAYSGGGKPVILAAYLAPFREGPRTRAIAAAQLLTAAIVSHGGYHLLLGEREAALTQGYYSDYAQLTTGEAAVLRRYYDFLVRYLELFYDSELRDVSTTHTGWDNYEYQCLSHPTSPWGEAGSLWLVIREKERRKCLFLINLIGCADDDWNSGKDIPTPQRDVQLRVQVDLPIRGIYAASPDRACLGAIQVPFEYAHNERGLFAEFTVPEVAVWTAVWLDF